MKRKLKINHKIEKMAVKLPINKIFGTHKRSENLEKL